jgi:thiol-disulfide isomerase/thioredoxin
MGCTTMLFASHAAATLVILLAPSVTEGVDQKPAETLAAIKKEGEAGRAELRNGRKPGTTEAEQKKAAERYHELMGDLGRRSLALARTHPDAPDAVEAVLWAHAMAKRNNNPELYRAAYDMLAEHFLDSDAIVRVCALAWLDVVETPHPEAFLRTAVERSKNVNVRAICCLSLGRHQQDLARLVRDINDPVRGQIVAKNLERLGPEVALIQRLRALDPERLEREATNFLERTIKDFGGLQPMGKASVRLGERAAGELFQMRHLGIGQTPPDIEGEDIDGKPMRLSEFRGKVVVISFWATWCGPCMQLVPHDRALVEKMKGRPFVLVGVNGDDDRERVKTVSAKEGINWRSFWSGSARQGIPLQWGVSGWPTIFVIDGNGVIRDNGLVFRHEVDRSAMPNKMIESLVEDAEASSKR